MILSQRIILMMVMINIVCGFATEISMNPGMGADRILNQSNSEFDTIENAIKNEDEWTSHMKYETTEYGQTAMNPIFYGNMLMGTIKNALNPFSVIPWRYSGLEMILAYILMLIRGGFILLVSMEIYFIFINKKNT